MRITKILLAIGTLGLVVLTGCANIKESDLKYKTETESYNVTTGMIPQTIEKTVTYIRDEQSGEWIEEKSTIDNWAIDPTFNIQDTVWIINSDDASSLYSNFDSTMKNVPLSLYTHFKSDLKRFDSVVVMDGDEPVYMDIKLDMTCDMVLDFSGEKIYLEGVKVLGSQLFMDGSSNVTIDTGDGEGIIYVPIDVKKGVWTDFYQVLSSLENPMTAVSETFIEKTIFDDIPTFEVSSNNIIDGIWDDKITNTKYGSNTSPQLSWEEVENATNYVVLMIDGTWLHMDVFTEDTTILEGSINRGDRGMQYVGPYPPSGTHTYSIFVFALKGEANKIPLLFDAAGNNIDDIYKCMDEDVTGEQGNVIAYGRLDGNYTHKN